jgi:hypothetical protein
MPTPLQTIAPSCGILIGADAQGRFDHIGTAWCVGDGEWVTAWAGEDAPVNVRLLWANGGEPAAVEGWECEGGVAGFTARIAGEVPALKVRRGADLSKREPLMALGYPRMIDHPAVRLHRGSLDAERYFPYLCPWTIGGHLALFTQDDGFLTGRFYDGMAGGPVFDAEGHAVGVLLDGEAAPDHPALTRFHRLA